MYAIIKEKLHLFKGKECYEILGEVCKQFLV